MLCGVARSESSGRGRRTLSAARVLPDRTAARGPCPKANPSCNESDRDLRYSTAPASRALRVRASSKCGHSIADALSLGRDPLTIAARALGVERDEAAIELDRLRAAGLVGDGLTLLAGGRTRRRSGSAATPAESEAVEAVRAALAAFTGSRRALCARPRLQAKVRCARSRRAVDPSAPSCSRRWLRTSKCVPTGAYQTQLVRSMLVRTTLVRRVGTHPVSPSDPLFFSLF